MQQALFFKKLQLLWIVSVATWIGGCQSAMLPKVNPQPTSTVHSNWDYATSETKPSLHNVKVLEEKSFNLSNVIIGRQVFAPEIFEDNKFILIEYYGDILWTAALIHSPKLDADHWVVKSAKISLTASTYTLDSNAVRSMHSESAQLSEVNIHQHLHAQTNEHSELGIYFNVQIRKSNLFGSKIQFSGMLNVKLNSVGTFDCVAKQYFDNPLTVSTFATYPSN